MDAQFVHLPGEDTTSGLWAEAAIDGLVLFDRGGQMSAALTRVRRVVHGQPYWAEAF